MTTSLHSAQLDLLGARPALFSGWTYRHELDQARLTSMLRRVLFALMEKLRLEIEAGFEA